LESVGDGGMSPEDRRAALIEAAEECLREVELLTADAEGRELGAFAMAETALRLADLLRSLEKSPVAAASTGGAARSDRARAAAQALALDRFAAALAGPATQSFAAVVDPEG
ncbi:hypothetical protein JZU48_02575, partial [bacterium]|nr:hypothetical protein [bacterium]